MKNAGGVAGEIGKALVSPLRAAGRGDQIE